MIIRIIFALFIVSICPSVQAANFTYLGSKTIDELNYILKNERQSFLHKVKTSESYKLPRSGSAKNEIDIYKVEYQSIIPEQDNRPITAHGLLAIPKGANPSALSFLSYQHGTVFGKKEVPSYSFLPDDRVRYTNSYETRLAVAQFAGNGYIVFAADYFGMGDSTEPEGYLVKASQQQACLDLYLAVKDWLKTEKNIEQDKLFLSGWSQGGFVTMAFLQKLEEKGVPVQAASTAAGHPDFFALFAGGIYHPRKNAALWNVAGFALAAWSYENYYRRPGLVNDLFKSEYQEDIKKLYDRSYSSNQEMQEIIGRLSSCDEKGCVLDVKRLLLDKYNDPSYFANSEFGQYSKISEARYGYYKTPTRMYYGTLDEALPPPLSKLTADYQKAIGNKHLVFALPVEKANHRATFLTAISRQYAWFNRR